MVLIKCQPLLSVSNRCSAGLADVKVRSFQIKCWSLKEQSPMRVKRFILDFGAVQRKSIGRHGGVQTTFLQSEMLNFSYERGYSVIVLLFFVVYPMRRYWILASLLSSLSILLKVIKVGETILASWGCWSRICASSIFRIELQSTIRRSDRTIDTSIKTEQPVGQWWSIQHCAVDHRLSENHACDWCVA